MTVTVPQVPNKHHVQAHESAPRSNAVVPLPDFLKIGSSAEIREVGIEKNIQK